MEYGDRMRLHVLGLLTLTGLFAGGYLPYLQAAESPAVEAASKAKLKTSNAHPALANNAPAGQLGTNVTPRHYELQLTLIPEDSSFSGNVTIDVYIAQASDHIFLHGQQLNVEKVTLQQGSLTLNADYKEVGDSGVARIDLPQKVSGDVSLSLRAPLLIACGLWRTDESRIKASFRRHAGCTSRNGNAEPGLVCKPRRARPEAHICGVANLARDNQPWPSDYALQLHASGHAEAASN